MSSGLDDLGPMPLWFRRCFKAISCHEALRRITRQGVRATVPTPTDIMLQLEGGDFLLIEACRNEEGDVRMGYHFLWKEDFPARLHLEYGSKKEVSHAGSHGTRWNRSVPKRVA